MGLIPAGVLMGSVTVLRAARVSNGEGGWTDSWASMGQARGSVVARTNINRNESMEAGAPSGQELVNVVVDCSVVNVLSSDRIQDPDGFVYELTTVTRQGDLLFGEGRRV